VHFKLLRAVAGCRPERHLAASPVARRCLCCKRTRRRRADDVALRIRDAGRPHGDVLRGRFALRTPLKCAA